MRVLYVCPFANHAGHPPTAAATETKALAEEGVDVTLLTFDGLMKGVEASVPHYQIMPRQNVFDSARKRLLSQWMLRMVETSTVFTRAAWSGYDIIHVRDGDPFVWMPVLCSSPFKKPRWFVSLMGSSLFTTGGTNGALRSVFDFAANSKVWKRVIKVGVSQGNWRFIAQEKRVADAYEEWMDGVLSGHISVIERGAPPIEQPMDKLEARKKLGLPDNKTVLLVFGATHSGKDIETVLKAVLETDIVLLFAGSSEYSIGNRPMDLANKYGYGNARIFDKYITETDKAMYFGAADACVLSYTKDFKATSSMLWESCRFGVPVIASDSNHLKDDAVGLGQVFKAQDAESLKHAIWRFQVSEDKTEVRDRCLEFAKSKSLNVWAKNCIKEYMRGTL